MRDTTGRTRSSAPSVVPYVLGAVAVVLVLAAIRPGWAVVAGVLALLLLPGRWWRWRTRRFRRGVKALRRGETGRARAELEAFLREVEADDRFHRLQRWFNLGRPYPYVAAARSNLGIVALREGEPVAAVGEFERAVEADPGFAQALYGLGVARWRLGDLEGAEAAALAAAGARGSYLPARVLLGVVRRERGDEAGAEAALEEVRERGHEPEELLRRFEAEWGGGGPAVQGGSPGGGRAP